MSALEALREALRLLRAHKLRAALTLFGLVWGTASVILLVSWGDGVVVMLEEGFFRAGRNMGQLWAGRVGEEFTPAVDRRYLRFTWDDVHHVRANARLPELVGSETRRYVTAAFRQRGLGFELRGVEPESTDIRGARVAAGRQITRADVDHRRRVLVVGHVLRQRLLGAGAGIGSWVRIDGTPFQVVGVLERKGTQLTSDGDPLDEQGWIPITTAMALWPVPGSEEQIVTTLIYRLRDRALYAETRDEIRALLARRLGVDPADAEAVHAWSAIEMMDQLPLGQLGAVMLLLSAATLGIGGIGTLNMMIDTVHERRGEIGVRLAIGARRRDVLLQFFLETLCVVGLGGALGLALGIGACLALDDGMMNSSTRRFAAEPPEGGFGTAGRNSPQPATCMRSARAPGSTSSTATSFAPDDSRPSSRKVSGG